jgi:hypothetical protein
VEHKGDEEPLGVRAMGVRGNDESSRSELDELQVRPKEMAVREGKERAVFKAYCLYWGRWKDGDLLPLVLRRDDW